MVGEIGAALTSLKTAFDIAKGINDMVKNAEVQTAVISLQSQILSAQQAALAATERETSLKSEIEELKNQIASFDLWQTEQQRFELLHMGHGFYAFALKAEERGDEPHYALCTNCFQHGKKSILICNGAMNVHQRTWDCPSCKAQYACTSKDMTHLITTAQNSKAKIPS